MKKYLVIDTNVPLTDASAIINLSKDGSIIVIPETVLAELDEKKSGFEEINWQARATARILASGVNTKTMHSDFGITTELVIDTTTVHIVSLHNYNIIPGYAENDQRIIQVADVLTKTFIEDEVVLMTIDFYMRIRAQAVGINTVDYKIVNDIAFEFVKELEIAEDEVFRTLHDTKIYDIDTEHNAGNYSYKFTNPDTEQVKLATISNGLIKVLGKETETELRNQDCVPINAEQLLVSKAIQDPKIDLVLVEGLAGSGKNIVAVSNAIRLLKMNMDKYRSIVYIRNPINDEEKGEDIGYLSGNDEKLQLYLGPMQDTLDFIVRHNSKAKAGDKAGDLDKRVQEGVEKLIEKCNIESIITTGLRGKTFHNTIVILDEWQNSSQATCQKVLTRIGKSCKVIVIGSQRQIDNKWVTKYNNGLAMLMGEARDRNILDTGINMFAIELKKVTRSNMALFAEKLFSKGI